MSLSQIAADLEAHFKAVENTAKTFLEQHVPAVAAAARRIESSPLMQACEAVLEVLSPQAEEVLAKTITGFAVLLPPGQPGTAPSGPSQPDEATAAQIAAAADSGQPEPPPQPGIAPQPDTIPVG